MRARKPSDPGSGRSSGRLGLAVLALTAAAFLVIGVAQAAALPKITFHGAGSGSGEMANAELEILEGNPPIGCSYASPGPEKPGLGSCEPEAEEFEIFKGVAVVPTAAPGSEFAGWIKKVNVGVAKEECGPNCDLVLLSAGEPHEVTALFCLEGQSEEECLPPPTPTLAVAIEEGEGTVVSSPAGIECPSDCDEVYAPETEVTLTASPAPGYLFKGWKKCDTGGVNGRQCKVKTTAELKTVGAKFIPAFNLDATKNISNGIFNTKPGGVNCGYGCLSSSALYKEGEVTLKTKPAKHFHFVEYTGGTGSAASCNTKTTETCSFSITEDSAIEELYAEDAKNLLTLSKTGGGQAFIKTKPTAINCGYTCLSAEGEFYANETAVPITIKLNKGTTSLTWTSGAGTCTGTIETLEATCEVDMSSAHSLVADLQ